MSPLISHNRYHEQFEGQEDVDEPVAGEINDYRDAAMSMLYNPLIVPNAESKAVTEVRVSFPNLAAMVATTSSKADNKVPFEVLKDTTKTKEIKSPVSIYKHFKLQNLI